MVVPIERRQFRITTGLLFLWAFADKAFGLGYATRSQNAWFSGGSPTKGFLSKVSVGPLESTFHELAGSWPALSVLSEAQREVLRLRVVDGLSAEQAATLLGCSPETVRLRQHRALEVPRNELDARSGSPRSPDS